MAIAVTPDLILPGPRQPSRAVVRRSPGAAVYPRPAAALERRRSAAVYRRRRLVVFGVLAFVVMGLGVAVRAWMSAPAAALPPSRPVAARVWVVHPGDTLWSIALASGDRGDIRPLVDRLSAEVHNQPLQVGERLILP
jgi:hypothetical protein